MARALSLDLRERVVESVIKGMPCRQAAVRFGVSASSAIRWAAQVRSGGALVPMKQGGERRSQHIEAEAVHSRRSGRAARYDARLSFPLAQSRPKVRGTFAAIPRAACNFLRAAS
jgi:transposase